MLKSVASLKPRTIQTVKVIPSARRLVTSLRDLGYDFVHAVADLVDNSVAARASEVKIDLKFAGPDSWVRIADNGTGMGGGTITEAMRYGAERSYEDDDLGKFGLGLKTASMSQCRRLLVASRVDPDRARIEARCLDLDHVEKSDQWEVFVLGPEDRPEALAEPLSGGTGTVVMWQALDRVMAYKLPWGQRAEAALLNLAEQLDQHLGMVFHRFLAGEVKRRKKLTIWVNTHRVEAWDPFAREEKATETLPGVEMDVRASDCVGVVRFQPYVLPPAKRFSTPDAFKRLAGPNNWNAQQGFYIYRANRLIQSGGWSRTRTMDEHSKLARASIDFFSDLDTAFEVNVAKFRVSLPEELKAQLKGPMENWMRRAQAVYRQHDDDRDQSGKASQRASASGRGSSRKGKSNGSAAGHSMDSLRAGKAIVAAAKEVGEAKALDRIQTALRQTNSEAADFLGW